MLLNYPVKNGLYVRSSLAVPWLGPHMSTARGLGLISGQGTKIYRPQVWTKKGLNWKILLCVYAAAAAAKSLQSCPTLCDPIDGSPPGSPVPGILQARTLEWVANAFSNA